MSYTPCSKFQETIVGNRNEFSLNNRILNGAFFVGFILTVNGEIFNWFFNFSPLIHVVMIFGGLSYAALYYFSRFRKQYKYSKPFLFINSVLIISTGWFTMDGINGSVPTLFILASVVFLTVFPKRYRILSAVTLVGLLGVLFVIQVYFPGLFDKYPSDHERIADILFSITFSIILLSFFILALKNSYETEREIVLEQKAELDAAHQKLVEVNETKERLYSVIAHDLRSPFQSIHGFADFLLEYRQTFTPEETEKYLNLIKKSAEDTLGLLENLLDWTRYQQGILEVQIEAFSLSDLINDVVALVTPAAELKDITFQVYTEKSESVHSDRNIIQAILRNLLSNAIKYTSHAGHIVVRYFVQNGQFVLEVADDGIGMSEEQVQRIFNPDKTARKKGPRSESGAGLGLKLCLDFTEKLKGTLQIRSVQNQGTSVILTFPDEAGVTGGVSRLSQFQPEEPLPAFPDKRD